MQGQAGPQHLGQVAGDDGEFGEGPEQVIHPRPKMGARKLRQVAPGDDADTHGEALQKNGGQVGEQDDAE